MGETRVRRARVRANRRRGATLHEAVEHMTDRREDTECWSWRGVATVYGYGQLNYGGKIWRSHRAAYTALVGPIPPGVLVLHSCDNRICVNPTHLRLGTHAENNADMMTRQRTTSRRTVDEVREIRAAYAAGETQASIAVRYGITQASVSLIVRRKVWARV